MRPRAMTVALSYGTARTCHAAPAPRQRTVATASQPGEDGGSWLATSVPWGKRLSQAARSIARTAAATNVVKRPLIRSSHSTFPESRHAPTVPSRRTGVAVADFLSGSSETCCACRDTRCQDAEMVRYPDPTKLGFRHSDSTGHDGGGWCASKSTGRIRGWDDLIDQHLNAFDLLVKAAIAEGGGWGLTRPVLFEAHHICELILKRLLAQRSLTSKSHKLAELWALAEPQLPKRVTKRDRAWLGSFIAEMAGLTSDGQDGRFPDAKKDISAKWCCLNVPEMDICVGTTLLILRGR